MKQFVVLLVAVCLVAFTAQDSFAQCRGGGYGGFYGGGGYYRGPVGHYHYRPGINVGYSHFHRPFYGGYGGYHGYYRPFYGYRGISIRF